MEAGSCPVGLRAAARAEPGRRGNRALSAIGFGMSDAPIAQGAALDILFSPEHNEWNGTTSIQLRLRDFRASATEAFAGKSRMQPGA